MGFFVSGMFGSFDYHVFFNPVSLHHPAERMDVIGFDPRISNDFCLTDRSRMQIMSKVLIVGEVWSVAAHSFGEVVPTAD